MLLVLPLTALSLPTFLHAHLCSGQIERRFIEVPFGASWVEATMRTYGFDTARRFFIDTVQVKSIVIYCVVLL